MCVTAVLLRLEGVMIKVNTQIHLRHHLVERHNQIVDAVADEFRQLGFDVIRSGYEAGGDWYDPDLFLQQPAGGLGFYLEIKTPQRERIAIDLDEWLRFRILGDVLVLAVFGDSRFAVLNLDSDCPAFWGAAADDCIPVLAAEQLRVLDVPLRLFKRGSPQYTSNKPFVVFKPTQQLDSLQDAIEFILSSQEGSRE